MDNNINRINRLKSALEELVPGTVINNGNINEVWIVGGPKTIRAIKELINAIENAKTEEICIVVNSDCRAILRLI